MKKIALIGVENSHAPAFGKTIKENPEKYADIEVVGVYSYDGQAAAKMVADGYAPMAADHPGYFLDKVDAVINTARHGDAHYEYSMPYIKAGIPIFIDKPFCISPRNAREMLDTAEQNGTLLCGGSSLKFAKELLDAKASLEAGEVGTLLSASLSAPVSMSNAYGNFWFYAGHLAQMLLTLLGMPQSVLALARDEAVTVLCRYADFDVTLHYVSYYYSVTLYGTKKSLHAPIALSTDIVYTAELDEFCDMLRTGKMETTYDELAAPVALMDAIDRSMRSQTWQDIRPVR